MRLAAPVLEIRKRLVLEALMEGLGHWAIAGRYAEQWGVKPATVRKYAGAVLRDLAELDADPARKLALKQRAAERFDAAYRMAEKLEQPAIMVQAEFHACRLQGLLDPVATTVNVNVNVPGTPREWEQRLAALVAEDPQLADRIKQLPAVIEASTNEAEDPDDEA